MRNLLLALMFSTSLLSGAILAKDHEVKLLTSGENGQTMIMSPGFIKVAKGDTITFIPADASHNAESMSIPQGATKFLTPMGQKFTYTASEEGVYLYKCTPHFVMGMIGVIQVGAATNIEQVKKDWSAMKASVAMNKERVDQYLAEVK